MQKENQKMPKPLTPIVHYATFNPYIDKVKYTFKTSLFPVFSLNNKPKTESYRNNLKHPTGSKLLTEGRFPIDFKRKKSNIQSIGSTITYARRYFLNILLNVVSTEDDTNENAPEIYNTDPIK
ncbi:ERF family protein [Bartonella sp. CB175]|uniref:ERF family protein n=1 Tax=Bartonella sp. CB175 TaxID=3112256 RepID=UPI00300DD344